MPLEWKPKQPDNTQPQQSRGLQAPGIYYAQREHFQVLELEQMFPKTIVLDQMHLQARGNVGHPL